MLAGRSSGKEAGAGSQDKDSTTFDGKGSVKRSTSFDSVSGALVISLTMTFQTVPRSTITQRSTPALSVVGNAAGS